MRRQEHARGRRIVKCARCGRHRQHGGRGYCDSCYAIVRRAEREGRAPSPYGSRKLWTADDDRYLRMLIEESGYTLQEAAEWLGRGVYGTRARCVLLGISLRDARPSEALRRRPCRACGGMEPHQGHGLCTRCYQRAARRGRVGRRVTCVRCGRERTHRARGMCDSCYDVTWSRAKREAMRDAG